MVRILNAPFQGSNAGCDAGAELANHHWTPRNDHAAQLQQVGLKVAPPEGNLSAIWQWDDKNLLKGVQHDGHRDMKADIEPGCMAQAQPRRF